MKSHRYFLNLFLFFIYCCPTTSVRPTAWPCQVQQKKGRKRRVESGQGQFSGTGTEAAIGRLRGSRNRFLMQFHTNIKARETQFIFIN